MTWRAKHIKFICRKALISCLILLVSTCISRAQEIHFSQFFEAPLLRNPALAGLFNGDYRIQGVYRDQWNSFTNAYRTGSMNAEYKMPVGKGDDFMTTGLQAVFDKAGTVGLSTTQLMPALNYHKSLSGTKTSYLSLGFMGGLIRKNIDIAKMTTNSQYNGTGVDLTLPNGELLTQPNFTTWDMNVGLSYNTSFGEDQGGMLFAGLAYHHLNRPKNSFYRNPAVELKPRYVASAGVKFPLDEFSYFTIQADHSIQGSFTETIGGALYSWKLGPDPQNTAYTLHAGAFLRWKDALIPVIKMDMQALSIAISYDVNVSQLKTASMGRGGFELSLVYTGFIERDNSSQYKMLCPRF